MLLTKPITQPFNCFNQTQTFCYLNWLVWHNFIFFIFLFVVAFQSPATKITSCHSASQAIHHPGKMTWTMTHLALTISMRPMQVLLTKLCPFGLLACTSRALYLHITLRSRTPVNPLNISPNLRICP